MELFDGIETVPAGFGPSAVTIGKFDGVHLGHRGVIDRLVTLAAERDLAPVVVTFDRNPLALLRPEACPEPLASNAQRAELLAQSALAATLMLEFTRALSELSPEDFVQRVLVDALHTRRVVVGADFRFGHRGAGDVEILGRLGQRHGFDVLPLGDITVEGRRVSSTAIRELLQAGRIRDAAQLLGRNHRIRGVVVGGDQIGRAIGFPTANLDPKMEGFLPADGVYAAWAHLADGRFPAAVSIGNNPTFEGIPAGRTEAHLIDFSGDVYGEVIELEFVDRIRSMQRFEGIPQLVSALAADVERIREILAGEHSGAGARAPEVAET